MINKLFNKRTRVTTYSKVVTVLLIVTFGFILLFSILVYYSHRLQQQTYKSSADQLERELNSLLELNSDFNLTLINEVTYWDELITFINKKDITWFNTSIAYLVDTNRADFICAYNINKEFITKVSSTKIRSYGFIEDEIFTQLKKDKLIKFYTKVPEGILEVFGSTIHASNDPYKNKTPLQGYFFMVKLIDAKYFNDLENISGTKIEFLNPNLNRNKHDIFYNKIIKNYKGEKIATISFKRINKVDFSTTQYILLIMFISFLISILIFFYYAKKWSKTPIKLIKEVLQTESITSINALKNIKGEFRYIGKLFEENSIQKLELQKTKEKAVESDTLKSAFLMNISHEIRTPLNAIVGFSDLLINSESTEVEKKEYVDNIKMGGENLVAIIDDLVEMSKIDSNLITPNYSSVNLHQFLTHTFIAIQQDKNLEKGLELKFIVPENKPEKDIFTDVTKLYQIITNLLTNAVKFTNEGFIYFEYKIDNNTNWLHFSVKDSGIGISEENQKLIFKRFSRIQNVSKTDNKGLGLGLAISKSYVQMLGGTIKVDSKLGFGSTFEFSIPFIYNQDNIDLNNLDSNFAISKDLGEEELILVAEDENINYIIMEKLIKKLNINVIRAKNGKEAVQICKENQEIDLVLMDIKMPEMDGHEAYREIRKFNTKVPIVAQSAYSFPEEVAKIKKTGFNEFLSKPLDKEKLYAVIKKYMVS